jgi:hypothetical protein
MRTSFLQIQFSGDPRPALTRSEVFADDKAKVDRNRQVALVDGFFRPVGSLFYIAPEKRRRSAASIATVSRYHGAIALARRARLVTDRCKDVTVGCTRVGSLVYTIGLSDASRKGRGFSAT